MAVLVFVLSLVLLAAGAASGYMSLDLLPTSSGLVYAFAGAVSVVGAIVVFALGVLVVRVGDLTKALREQAAVAMAAAGPALVDETAEPSETEAEGEAVEAEPTPETAPEEATAATGAEAHSASGKAEGETTDADEPLNESRAGGSPTLGETEEAIETPGPPPTLIGRYSSGGAQYMIFSDGTIEAETVDGAFKFASMGDFKKYLLDRNAGKA
jgi:hypothetical protein